MGTRADFYIGRGENAEWLGSIALDGYPSGIPDAVLTADSEERFRADVAAFLAETSHATLPEHGWPWPWNDSRTSDYAYAFEDGAVWAACFGYRWCSPSTVSDDEYEGEKTCVFPQMDTKRSAKPGSHRSGVMLIGIRREPKEPTT